MNALPPEVWGTIIVALLSGGFLKFAADTYKDFRNRPSRDVREVATIEQSITTVARARDELEEDNVRIRKTLHEERISWSEERKRYENDRACWRSERADLRSEIAELEKRIKTEAAEAQRRYDDLLKYVHEIQNRGR